MITTSFSWQITRNASKICVWVVHPDFGVPVRSCRDIPATAMFAGPGANSTVAWYSAGAAGILPALCKVRLPSKKSRRGESPPAVGRFLAEIIRKYCADSPTPSAYVLNGDWCPGIVLDIHH